MHPLSVLHIEQLNQNSDIQNTPTASHAHSELVQHQSVEATETRTHHAVGTLDIVHDKTTTASPELMLSSSIAESVTVANEWASNFEAKETTQEQVTSFREPLLSVSTIDILAGDTIARFDDETDIEQAHMSTMENISPSVETIISLQTVDKINGLTPDICKGTPSIVANKADLLISDVQKTQTLVRPEIATIDRNYEVTESTESIKSLATMGSRKTDVHQEATIKETVPIQSNVSIKQQDIASKANMKFNVHQAITTTKIDSSQQPIQIHETLMAQKATKTSTSMTETATYKPKIIETIENFSVDTKLEKPIVSSHPYEAKATTKIVSCTALGNLKDLERVEPSGQALEIVSVQEGTVTEQPLILQTTDSRMSQIRKESAKKLFEEQKGLKTTEITANQTVEIVKDQVKSASAAQIITPTETIQVSQPSTIKAAEPIKTKKKKIKQAQAVTSITAETCNDQVSAHLEPEINTEKVNQSNLPAIEMVVEQPSLLQTTGTLITTKDTRQAKKVLEEQDSITNLQVLSAEQSSVLQKKETKEMKADVALAHGRDSAVTTEVLSVQTVNKLDSSPQKTEKVTPMVIQKDAINVSQPNVGVTADVLSTDKASKAKAKELVEPEKKKDEYKVNSTDINRFINSLHLTCRMSVCI